VGFGVGFGVGVGSGVGVGAAVAVGPGVAVGGTCWNVGCGVVNGAAVSSAAGSLGSAESDGSADEVVDAFVPERARAVGEGTPARMSPAGDDSTSTASVGRRSLSQLEPMATDAATSTNAAAALA
jgi:hypothetical protein